MPGERKQRDEMVEQGDVIGLLRWVRSQPVEALPADVMDDVARAVRTQESENLTGLIETAFGEILGFSTILLIRCQLYVQRRLDECTRAGGATEIPADLDNEGWLTRCERIARFIAEISATYGRIQHVDALVQRNGRSSRPRKSALGAPMGNGQGKNGVGQSAPGPGWFGSPQVASRFP